jgi:hypothetical protein
VGMEMPIKNLTSLPTYILEVEFHPAIWDVAIIMK